MEVICIVEADETFIRSTSVTTLTFEAMTDGLDVIVSGTSKKYANFLLRREDVEDFVVITMFGFTAVEEYVSEEVFVDFSAALTTAYQAADTGKSPIHLCDVHA